MPAIAWWPKTVAEGRTVAEPISTLDLFPTIATSDTCDFGCLDEDSGRFTLSTYLTPNNFRGYVARGEAMRVHVIAAAHNVQSIKPLLLEVSWDGQWSADLDEMQRHLVIKEVTR